ncbi:MAG: hypothetical protein IJV47_02435 [Candidatus Methanomethylophilaceae archaeon]|nr:hypothetical protein [Candidatus Methanomethylophilaceae archaeon]MBQ9689454.1 hypothetical protein [Candidatus Methanomethylophilaceae archaeon]
MFGRGYNRKTEEYRAKKTHNWGKYLNGDVWFHAYVSKGLMHISQEVVENDEDDGTEIASMVIPLDIVKEAIVDDMVPEGALAREFVLTVVPDGTEIHAVDVVSLKIYRDRLEDLFQAKQGLADARQAFGWQSEAAKFAEKVVEAKQMTVDNVYAQLTGNWEDNEKETKE